MILIHAMIKARYSIVIIIKYCDDNRELSCDKIVGSFGFLVMFYTRKIEVARLTNSSNFSRR